MARSINLGGGQMYPYPRLFENSLPETVLGRSGPLLTAFYQMIHPRETHRIAPLGTDAGIDETGASRDTSFSLIRAYLIATTHDICGPWDIPRYRPVALTAVESGIVGSLGYYLSALVRYPMMPPSPRLVDMAVEALRYECR